jgi:hypothetical protein
MKTKITLCLLFALSIVTLKAQVAIANFDDGTLNGIAFTIEGNAVSSFEVVDNPQTVGLNASLKSLKLVNANGEWWGGLKMTLAQQITVSEENRYMHIMMKFKDVGLQNFHFALYSSDNEKWSELTNAQNVWFDYVVDLKNIENVALTDLASLRFLSRPDNYTNQGNEVYIDEIVINNNPIARGSIADFNNGTFNNLTCSIEGNGVTSFEVIDNPAISPLNPSAKSLKVINGNGEDWGGLKMILAQQITVSEQNRYMHIMMKFQNVGIQNFHFAMFSTTAEKWSTLTNAQNEWFDYVIDLTNVENAALDNLVAIRYLPRSANYTNPGNVVYIDEMIINNDPMPRGGYNFIDVAGTIADFNDGTLNDLACYDDGGGVASFEVDVNPDQSGINNTSDALKFVVSPIAGDWWPGLKIGFKKPVFLNDKTRYLHVMTYNTSADQSYEFNLYIEGEKYQGEKTTEIGWVDHVFDLNSEAGKQVTGFRYSTRIDKPANLGKTRYIDEIAFNDSATPRSISTAVEKEKVSLVNVFSTNNGITIQGVEGKFSIYNVSGVLVQKGIANGNTTVRLSKGFYIVDLGTECHKVSVK